MGGDKAIFCAPVPGMYPMLPTHGRMYCCLGNDILVSPGNRRRRRSAYGKTRAGRLIATFRFC